MPNEVNSAILRLPAVIKKTGLSRSTIYRLEAQSIFPARVILTINTVGWRECEIDEFLASRPRANQAVGGAQ